MLTSSVYSVRASSLTQSVFLTNFKAAKFYITMFAASYSVAKKQDIE